MKDDIHRLKAENERLRAVVNASLAYKASLLQTISSRPVEDQEKPMQGRLIARQEFIAACDVYEAAEVEEGKP